MIDLSSIRTPGWARVVAELNAPAADDRAFFGRLLGVMGQVSGSKQAVLYVVEPKATEGEAPGPVEPRPVMIWSAAGGAVHPAGDGSGIESAGDARSAALAAAEDGQSRVFGLGDRSNALYDEAAQKGYVVALPLQPPVSDPAAAVGPRPVITLLIDPRSRQALQTTLALVEVLTGYVAGHGSRQALRRARSASVSLDLAARLIASVNMAEGFRGAAMQFVNDLCRQLKADRVALGWVRGVGHSGDVRVVALSDTEYIDRRTLMVRRLEAAMDECLDQDQPVVFPPPAPAAAAGGVAGAAGAPTVVTGSTDGGEPDVLLSQAITHAHRELASGDARLRVASLPLRCEIANETKVVGVVTVESGGETPMDLPALELLQAALDLVGPLLLVRRSDARPLPSRAWASAVRAGAWAVGSRHTVWKLLAVLLLVFAVLAFVVPLPYRVEAAAEVQPGERHVVSMPFDGVIAAVATTAKPGQLVKAGDLLVELDTTELKLNALAAASQVLEYEKQADAALKTGRIPESQQARARAAQAIARRDLAEFNIGRARIVAPVDGTIIAGDLSDRIGASVKLGEALVQIAPLSAMRVNAYVADRDIALIRPDGTGEITTRADPSRAFPLVIERVVPLAQPREGRNVFEVRCVLSGPPQELMSHGVRPGSEAVVKFDAGRHPLAYIATRRIRDTLRLWLWW